MLHFSNCCRGSSKKMCLVALIMLVLRWRCNSATVSSDEGLKLCMCSIFVADRQKQCALLVLECLNYIARRLSQTCNESLNFNFDDADYEYNLAPMHID